MAGRVGQSAGGPPFLSFANQPEIWVPHSLRIFAKGGIARTPNNFGRAYDSLDAKSPYHPFTAATEGGGFPKMWVQPG
jgi:hypothetical protein